MPIVKFKGNTLDPATTNALVSETLVNGSKPSVWWKRQSTEFRNKFMDTVRTSMGNGESLTQAITRVTGGTIDGITTPGILATSKKKAGALVSTAMSAVTNEAALKTYQQNTDVIKWISQLSTLDNKTSDICVAYSGQTWDAMTLVPVAEVGSSLPFNGGPPRHFNCRSRLRPVTKSFKELGLDKAEIPPGTRASMDGQIPADITFDQFLKSKGIDFQNKLLGPRRAQLWRDDKITLTQLVDMRGNPMTLTRLEQKLGIKRYQIKVKKQAPEGKVDSWIDNVFITAEERREIEAAAKKLVAKAQAADDAVTAQIVQLADEVNGTFPAAAAPGAPEGAEEVVKGSLTYYRLKGTGSTARKIQTYADKYQITYAQAAERISDSLRYTFVLDDADYVAGVIRTMERFAEMGYKNGKFDAAWFYRPDYKGLNVNMISPQGVRMELQFHTARSFQVKQYLNHPLYEEFRVLPKNLKVGDYGKKLQKEMLDNANSIKAPPKLDDLKDLVKVYNLPDEAAQARIFEKAKLTKPQNKVAREATEKAKKEAAEDIAEKQIARYKLKEAEDIQDFDFRASNAIQLLPEGSAERALLESKVKVLRIMQKDQFNLYDAKIAFSEGKPWNAHKLLTEGSPQRKIIEEAEERATAILQALEEAIKKDQIVDMDDFVEYTKKIFKEKLTAEEGWIRRFITSQGKFEYLENQAKYKITIGRVEEAIKTQNLALAEQAMTWLPKEAPEYYKLAEKVDAIKKNIAAKIAGEFRDEAKLALKRMGYDDIDDVVKSLRETIEDIGKLTNGRMTDNARDQIEAAASDFVKRRNKAISDLSYIRKNFGAEDLEKFIAERPANIRANEKFAAEAKRILAQAQKTAKNARQAAQNHLKAVLTPDEYSAVGTEKIIEEALLKVHRKLGKKQLEDFVDEIKLKIVKQKEYADSFTISAYTEDLTDYGKIVREMFTDDEMKNLDRAVELWLKFSRTKNFGSSSNFEVRNILWDLTQGKSPAQKRAIDEYLHSKLLPKRLPSGYDVDKAVAEILAQHVSGATNAEIMSYYNLVKDGLDEMQIQHLMRIIKSRGGLKSLDDLGEKAAGLTDAQHVERIRAKIARLGDPEEVPLGEFTESEIRGAVNHWLYNRSDEELLAWSKGKMKYSLNHIEDGERLYGKGAWGVSPEDWVKWKETNARKLTVWDIALIDKYTGGMAATINSGLYNGGTNIINTAGARALNSALDKLPKYTGKTYRGASIDRNYTLNHVDARYEVGKIVTERNFGSSATRKEAAFRGEIHFTIIGKGKNGAIMGHLGQYGAKEMEVLYKAGTRYRVLKKVREQNRIKIWMEEV